MSAIVGGNLFKNADQVTAAIQDIGYRGTGPIQLASSRGFFLAFKGLEIQERPTVPPGWFVALDGLLWDDPSLFFERWRSGDINRIEGMFSFCTLGADQQEVHFGRDWAGMVPFYYIMRDGKIAFASEMKVLIRHLDAVGEEIRPFPPGHYSTYNIGKGQIEHRSYYTLPVYPEIEGSPEVISQNIKNLLVESFDQQVGWDVPVCVLLSGGIDSVVVAHLLKPHFSDLEAFVVTMGEMANAKDDIKYARKSAEFLQIPLHEINVDKDAISALIETGIWVAEDPKISMVSTAIPMMLLGKVAGGQGFKIAYTGEGSDGLWGSFGNIQAWFKESERFKTARHKLVTEGHKANIARTNKALQYGGSVQAMFPFLYRPLAEYAMGIHPRHMNETLPVWGRVMKPLFRHAFKGEIPDELLYRKKKTLQQGSHIEKVVKAFGQPELFALYEKHFPLQPSVQTIFTER